MEVKIPKRAHPNEGNYKKDELDIARSFASRIHKEMGEILKAVVLFGSNARKTSGPHSDIDVLVIIDDTATIITRDVAEGYRMLIQQVITKVSRRLHVVSLRLTSFWDYTRLGDPIAINILRDGVTLFDTGIFLPLQLLLQKGRIRPSQESIWSYYTKAPTTLQNARWHILQAVVDLYWAVIDAAHAALMSLDAIPPTPEHVGDMLDEILVNKGLLEKKYSDTMKSFYARAKAIMHKEIHDIKGQDFDIYAEEARAFIERMKEFIKLK